MLFWVRCPLDAFSREKSSRRGDIEGVKHPGGSGGTRSDTSATPSFYCEVRVRGTDGIDDRGREAHLMWQRPANRSNVWFRAGGEDELRSHRVRRSADDDAAGHDRCSREVFDNSVIIDDGKNECLDNCRRANKPTTTKCLGQQRARRHPSKKERRL